jgi:hypothetical protein
MEVPHAGDATGEEVMEVMYPRCAGLDVHKETVVACVRIVEGGDVSRSVGHHIGESRVSACCSPSKWLSYRMLRLG